MTSTVIRSGNVVRSVQLLVLLLIADPLLAQSVRSWNFRVYLDDKPVGRHEFVLRETALPGTPTTRELSSRVQFDVKLLFINAYRYQHQADEQWQGNCLRGMQAKTNDNGKQYRVDAQLHGAQLQVSKSGQSYSLPGCVMSFAYWNPVMLMQQQLLNAQTGDYDRVNIELLGEQTLKVRGAAQPAKHYRLSGNKLNIELWYAANGDWLSLESITDSGRRLRYMLE